MSATARLSPSATLKADKFPWLGLLILSGAIFVTVTSEFLPTGLLPELASGLRVTEAQVGLMVAVFAGTVVATAPLLTRLTHRFPRKALVVATLLIFALTNVIIAVVPVFPVVLAARCLGGLAHGLFWAVVGAYSAHLVSREHIPRAIAVTNMGGTLAFILGIPVGTALGHAVGWQAAFVTIAVAIVILAAMVVLFLPSVDHRIELKTGEIHLPGRKDPSVPGIVLVCVVVALLLIGHNTFYTYVVPFYGEVVGFDKTAVSVMLLVYGVAGALGLVLVGLLAKRFPRGSLVATFLAVSVAVTIIGLFASVPIVVIIGVVLWGTAFGAGPALLHTKMLQTASPRVRDQAAAWITVSFNLGIGGGAVVGGILFDAIGLGVLPYVEAGTVALGVLVLVLGDRALRRRADSTAREAQAAASKAVNPIH